MELENTEKNVPQISEKAAVHPFDFSFFLGAFLLFIGVILSVFLSLATKSFLVIIYWLLCGFAAFGVLRVTELERKKKRAEQKVEDAPIS